MTQHTRGTALEGTAICWNCGHEYPVEYAQTYGVVWDDEWYDSQTCAEEAAYSKWQNGEVQASAG